MSIAGSREYAVGSKGEAAREQKADRSLSPVVAKINQQLQFAGSRWRFCAVCVKPILVNVGSDEDVDGILCRSCDEVIAWGVYMDLLQVVLEPADWLPPKLQRGDRWLNARLADEPMAVSQKTRNCKGAIDG